MLGTKHGTAIARSSVKLGIGAVVLVTLGGSWAAADGGDPNLIHACIGTPDPGVSNVSIVGPNDSCGGSFPTSVHWPGGDPAIFAPGDEGGDEGVETEAKPIAKKLAPSKKVIKKVYSKLGVKPNATVTVETVIGPSKDGAKSGGVECPGSHPFRVAGGYSVDLNLTGLQVPWYAKYFFGVLSNGPVGLHAWQTSIGWGLGIYNPWTLTIQAECAKVLTVQL